MKQKLTKTVIQNALPREKDYYLWCAELTGFAVRIHPASKRHPNGRKVFLVQGRDPKTGAQFKKAIGLFGVLNTEQARLHAKQLLSKVTLGENPFAKVTSMSFVEALELWAANPTPIDRRTGQPRKLTGAKRDYDRLRLHALPFLGGKALCDITQNDVAALKLRLETKLAVTGPRSGKRHYGHLGGVVTARRTIATLKSFFSYCVELDYLKENPAANIKLPADAIRGEFLTEEEVPAFLAALDTMRANSVNAKTLDQIELLFRTGCRKNEIQRLKWTEVCIEAKELRLTDTKTFKRTVFLCDKAIAIILRQRRTNSQYVFPSDHKPETYNQGAAKVFRTLRDRIGRPALTIHGLRHTHASRLSASGSGSAVISAALGIKSERLINTYAHTYGDEVRRRQNALR